jgi:hypothetical protein
MTIAIGAMYEEGVIVTVDSKIVYTDGSTTNSGDKIFLSLSPEMNALFAIANAAEDAQAAKTLANDISSALVEAHRQNKAPEAFVKRAMGKWYRSYGYSQVPVTEFLVGRINVNQHWAGLYYLQPPSTVLWKSPFAIGRGARPVEPLLGLLSNYESDIKPQLLLLAYLMYLAKKDEGSACGGYTHGLVLTKQGGSTFLYSMEEAEKLAAEIHSSVQGCIREIVGGASTTKDRAETKPFMQLFEELHKRAEGLAFPELDNLKRNFWKRKVGKP